MSTWILIDTATNEIVDTVFGYDNCDSEWVTKGEQGEYEETIHAIRDDDATKSLSEIENNNPDLLANNEQLYLQAIECGFMNPNTLETYEEII